MTPGKGPAPFGSARYPPIAPPPSSGISTRSVTISMWPSMISSERSRVEPRERRRRLRDHLRLVREHLAQALAHVGFGKDPGGEIGIQPMMARLGGEERAEERAELRLRDGVAQEREALAAPRLDRGAA